jgi:hypothetical protein
MLALLLASAGLLLSAEAPPPSCARAVDVGMDYTGNDIKHGGVKNGILTPAQCCAACAAAAGCNAWTLWVAGKQCYLKANAAGRTLAVNHTSGNYSGAHPPSPPDYSALVNDTDCRMRSLFVEYAARVNPNVGAQRAREMAEALSGDPKMGAGCRVQVPAVVARAAPPLPAAPAAGARVFADATKGSDEAAGTEAAPFKTVHRAVAAIRAGKAGGTVVLRAGVFHMNKTLELSSADANLTIETHPTDAPTKLASLSGAQPLVGVSWKRVTPSGTSAKPGANIWSADLSGSGFTEVPAMRWAGTRLQRARFPNWDAETGGGNYGGIKSHGIGASKWLPSSAAGVPPLTHYNAGTATERNDTLQGREYTMSYGTTSCAKYSPPISHFCGGNSDGGGGVVISVKNLPNQPYRNPAGATITAMHGGSWCSFTYAVGPGYSFTNGSGRFAFSDGGQQCGRPEGSHGPLLIEGVLEELDMPSEFHFDAQTKILTLWHNATSGTKPPTDGTLEVVGLVTLINASGSQASPVRGLKLRNLELRDTAPAVLLPHIAPTGGDWAVNRAAAVTISGGHAATIANCTFWKLDNAGIFLGGYGRNLSVVDNHFAWLGESAIVSVGDTEGVPGFPGFGVDGRSGNQPRGTTIRRNIAHEIGIVNKQSALYFQAATSGSLVQGNIGYNGARSGINFNDGFGTGSIVKENILFNLNRETADHGCFNSWDRLPFVPSRGPDHRDELSRNLFLSNYNSYDGFDTDDQSAYFHMKDNVLLYGHFLKSDYSGHSIEFENDLSVFGGPSNQYQAVPPSHPNSVHDSVMISATDGDILISEVRTLTVLYSRHSGRVYPGLRTLCCRLIRTAVRQVCPNASDWPKIYNIKLYSPLLKATVCGQPLAYWRAQGKLPNVTEAVLPNSSVTILGWARGTLGM